MKQYSKYQPLPCPLRQEELELFPQILSKLGALGNRNLGGSFPNLHLFAGNADVRACCVRPGCHSPWDPALQLQAVPIPGQTSPSFVIQKIRPRDPQTAPLEPTCSLSIISFHFMDERTSQETRAPEHLQLSPVPVFWLCEAGELCSIPRGGTGNTEGFVRDHGRAAGHVPCPAPGTASSPSPSLE